MEVTKIFKAVSAVAKKSTGVAKIPQSTVESVASFKKAASVNSILETKPQTFHGINPYLKFEDKTIVLPRFSSEEMQTARKMNQIARQQILHPIDRTFKKATPEDLKRLTSDAIEDSYSRAAYTKPETGEVFHLLKEGETGDGKIKLRILDKDGAFVKNAEIEPKTIAIIDTFELNYGSMIKTNDKTFWHGDVVKAVVQRNNPLAKLKIVKLEDFENKSMEEINQELKNVDFINASWGEAQVKSRFSNTKTSDWEPTNKLIELKLKPKIRVLAAGGNLGDEYVNLVFKNKNIEGVGSINSEGKISKFSSSRNSQYSQHYENGELKIEINQNGINFTGVPGTDALCNDSSLLLSFKLELYNDVLKDFCTCSSELQRYELCRSKDFQYKLFNKYKEIKNDLNNIKLNQNSSVEDKQRYERLTDFIDYFETFLGDLKGTSFSSPARIAKLALNDMMNGIL